MAFFEFLKRGQGPLGYSDSAAQMRMPVWWVFPRIETNHRSTPENGIVPKPGTLLLTAFPGHAGERMTGHRIPCDLLEHEIERFAAPEGIRRFCENVGDRQSDR